MLKHIWSLFAQAGSIWVAWVEENWLKGKSTFLANSYSSHLFVELEVDPKTSRCTWLSNF